MRMAWETILSFLATALLLALMPGVDNCFVLTESLAAGRKAGLSIVLGFSTGCLVHTFLCATGISLLFMGTPAGFAIIQYAGCAYFLYLAWSILRAQAANPLSGAPAAVCGTFAKGWRRGFFMNVMNPKVAIFFIAFLPQFVRSGGWPVFAQMIVLGLIFVLSTVIIFGAIALAAGSSRFFAAPKVWKALKYVQVVIFLVLAATLFLLDEGKVKPAPSAAKAAPAPQAQSGV